MKVFNCEFDEEIIDALRHHAEQEYPFEACGVILGDQEKGSAVRYVPLENQARDAEAADTFRICEIEHIRVLEAGRQDGLRPLAFFHSHPEAGSQLSARDREQLLCEGEILSPSVLQVVAGMHNRCVSSISAHKMSSQPPEIQSLYLTCGLDHIVSCKS